MAKLGYVRVSTAEQNEARQVEALARHEIDKWYIEKISGKNLDRPKLREMLDYAREGDTIFVKDWSRISRSTKDLLELVDGLREKGVHFASEKESFDTASPSGRLMLTVIAAINQFERDNMLERQREGVAIAKRAGKYKGRKKTEIADMAAVYHDYVTLHKSKAALARDNGVSRPTMDRLLKEYERANIATQGTG